MAILNDAATFRRSAAATGLVLAAVMSVAWTALEPPFPSGYAERLEAIDRTGTAAASAALFAASQLPMIAALLGIGHLIRHGAPVLSNLGTAVALAGAFGHAVFGGVSLMTVAMAGEPEHREIYAALIERVESSPVMAFAAVGLLGTVIGLVLLSVGLWRSGVCARWIPLTLGLFLVVEFVGSALSDYATYVSGLCFLAAFGGLAAQVARSPRNEWTVGARAERAIAIK